jgi:AcrR family transcriptional regulator
MRGLTFAIGNRREWQWEGIALARRSDHTKEELQELIVGETMKLVDQLGAANITTREIAARIGYTPGTLYTHFDNLADIFLQVNARILVRLRAQVQGAIHSADDPADRLLEMAYAYLGYAEAHSHWFALLFSHNLQPGQSVPDYLQEIIDSLFELVRVELTALDPNATTAELELGVRALWSGVHGICALSLSDKLFTQHWRADRLILKTLVSHFVASWSRAATSRERTDVVEASETKAPEEGE